MKKLLSILLLLVVTITLAGCNPETDDRPVIYVTTYPVGYLVEEISGGTINVQRVPGSNVHSEDNDWSAKEIISMQNSEYIFYVGANFDNFIPNDANLFSVEGDTELVHIGDYITFAKVCYEHNHDHDATDEGDEGDHHEEEVCDATQEIDDPHFWLDPGRMIEVAALVKDKLTELYPDNALMYSTNYAEVVLDLTELDEAYIAMGVDEHNEKPIITTNLLFNYWHDAYDLEIISLIQDAHTDSDIPGDIIEFKEEALLHDINLILYEYNSNSPDGDALIDALIAEGVAAESRTLYGLNVLTQENINNGDDYISLMWENLEVLIEATTGEADHNHEH